MGRKIKHKNLKYEAGKHKYDFQQNETIRSFGESIYSGKINVHESEMDGTNLLEFMVKFNNKSRPKTKEGKDKKRNTFDSVSALYDTSFRSAVFPIKEKQGKGLKILTPKQMLQRLPIAFAHVKAGNTSENSLNEIRQIIFFISSKRNY